MMRQVDIKKEIRSLRDQVASQRELLTKHFESKTSASTLTTAMLEVAFLEERLEAFLEVLK